MKGREEERMFVAREFRAVSEEICNCPGEIYNSESLGEYIIPKEKCRYTNIFLARDGSGGRVSGRVIRSALTLKS